MNRAAILAILATLHYQAIAALDDSNFRDLQDATAAPAADDGGDDKKRRIRWAIPVFLIVVFLISAAGIWWTCKEDKPIHHEDPPELAEGEEPEWKTKSFRRE
eukprot:CAMPEP_0176003374 /NCGR_PEP_ID=MMETSP0120_2-20121206/1140_1 /TAXON_ID=160619 /ORGANISM="Kryptoperidinium foliaceum, Strain CCMP 1326" /LENGTH=102 /DNA_ID=CAMNT_0017336013 /DNA_START=41 /DNA_END=346 /DNA_ORIENTATION=+